MKYHLDRSKFKSNQLFFNHIYNNLGCDFEIAYAEKDKWTCWYKYSTLMQLHKDTKISCLSIGWVKVDEFIELVNNRTVLDIEIVLDLDDLQVIKNYKNILSRVEDWNFKWYECYLTGGKGIHIHMIMPGLREIDEEDRKWIKSKVISSLLGETLKANKKVMIALEYSKHRKTGEKKVKMNGNGN